MDAPPCTWLFQRIAPKLWGCCCSLKLNQTKQTRFFVYTSSCETHNFIKILILTFWPVRGASICRFTLILCSKHNFCICSLLRLHWTSQSGRETKQLQSYCSRLKHWLMPKTRLAGVTAGFLCWILQQRNTSEYMIHCWRPRQTWKLLIRYRCIKTIKILIRYCHIPIIHILVRYCHILANQILIRYRHIPTIKMLHFSSGLLHPHSTNAIQNSSALTRACWTNFNSHYIPFLVCSNPGQTSAAIQSPIQARLHAPQLYHGPTRGRHWYPCKPTALTFIKGICQTIVEQPQTSFCHISFFLHSIFVCYACFLVSCISIFIWVMFTFRYPIRTVCD